MALSQEMNASVKNRPLPNGSFHPRCQGSLSRWGVMLGMMMCPDEKVILAEITFFLRILRISSNFVFCVRCIHKCVY